MQELIDREQAGKNICKYCASNSYCKEDDCMVYQGLGDTPTIQIEAEPVRHWKGCEYCKGRSYTKKPLTVITRTMKRVEVCFNFCPNCGRDMRATDTNVGGKGGADNG